MKKIPAFSVLASLVLFIGACQQPSTKIDSTTTTHHGKNSTRSIYSKYVHDSFSISIMLPPGYDPKGKHNYTVAYLLDANLYFDIIATAINKYTEVGMSPQFILVGIGYKNFETMDSLRNRDYTFPTAIPDYEMSVSGGADKFLRFINEELTTLIDKQYKSDTTHRILMGHSLGGYFVAYALCQALEGHSKYFEGYISASPSLHYNHYYLLDELKKLSIHNANNPKPRVYFSFGGLEDEEDDDEPGMMKVNELSAALGKLLNTKNAGAIDFKGDIYSNLGHMETAYPCFMKGLQLMVVASATP